MALSLNGQTFTPYEAQVACALRRYVTNSEGHTMDDETIGSIISFHRHGFGRAPVDCRGLVSTVQQSNTNQCRTLLTAVVNNRAYWEPEARRLYDRWLSIYSQAVQRLRVQGQIGNYL